MSWAADHVFDKHFRDGLRGQTTNEPKPRGCICWVVLLEPRPITIFTRNRCQRGHPQLCVMDYKLTFHLTVLFPAAALDLFKDANSCIKVQLVRADAECRYFIPSLATSRSSSFYSRLFGEESLWEMWKYSVSRVCVHLNPDMSSELREMLQNYHEHASLCHSLFCLLFVG